MIRTSTDPGSPYYGVFVTLQQTRNILAQFTRVKRELREEINQQLQELASCA